MNDIIKYNNDSFDEIKCYELSDLTYSIFENIDFNNFKFPISFFRSDFRGSKFSKVIFYKNNFDRSDFLNVVFLECNFNKVNFGCCQIKNCFFDNVTFKDNFYRSTSIHSSTFSNCNFVDESFLINMQRCTFLNCTINGCSFEMSTTDSDKFKECYITQSNLATMHAENHTFIKCTLQNIYFDESYYFGYNLSDCIMEDIYFLYRGKKVNLEDINMMDIFRNLRGRHRYFECLNLLKLWKKYDMIYEIIKEAINYFKIHIYGRKLELENLMNGIIFSIQQEDINFNLALEIIELFEFESWSDFTGDEVNELRLLILYLKQSLLCMQHSEQYINTIDCNEKSVLKIEFENDDYNICLSTALSIFYKFMPDKIEKWKLVNKEKGSWILTFVAPTIVLINVLPRMIREYSNVYFEIKLKKHLTNKTLELLDSPNLNVIKWKEIIEVTNTKLMNVETDKQIINDIKSISANI